MSGLQWTPNLKINLGPGTFRTSVTKPWSVNSGWMIAGAGMNQTVVQLTGNIAGMHYGIVCISSNPNLSIDNLVIRDLTCDANWAELSTTADEGAGSRSVSDAVISTGSPIISSSTASFSMADFGKRLTAGGIPSGTTIVSVQDRQHATMSANATASAKAVSLKIAGEKNVKTGAIVVWGSNNLIDHVRSINTYGSWANLQEQFAIIVAGPRSGDGINNVIQFCRAEQPYGNYGSPFSLSGWEPYAIVNSKVISCTAVGLNNGIGIGFTSGGVNFGGVKDCVIDSNTFIDCYGAAYSDTGSCDGIQVTNNVVTRGWNGVGLGSPMLPKQNIQISGNSFSIQNRNNGANGGITVAEAPLTNLTITNNTILSDTSGQGMLQFWGVTASLLKGAIITDNVVDPAFYNGATGTGVTLFNNRQPSGAPVQGL